MADLSTRYLGLKLKNPIIIASGPLTGSVESLKRCEADGAGAVVLKSIFEEQIESVVGKELAKNEEYLDHSDFSSYFENVSKDYYVNQYLQLLSEAKKVLTIPVIASINCTDISTWQEYIEAFEACGADAIELNYYPISQDKRVSGNDVDKSLIKFAKSARKKTKLPLSIKLSSQYSSLSNIISQLSEEKLNGLVLFNRFFAPDINIETETLTQASIYSDSYEYTESLRWIALMSAEVNLDLAATTGIHDGKSAIKMLLAGAPVCQICTAYLKDRAVIKRMLDEITAWMDRKGYSSIADFKGKLAQDNMVNGSHWERTQYMMTLVMEKNRV